ncbi:MAG: excinuclease ABC subunit UvrB [Candidatus Gracilibacteria bacterium]|nr:excinuclease ABC subunit UvrB [Candidatus Gracilibacteria bacterium]
MSQFKLVSEYKPIENQQKTIEDIEKSILAGNKYQTILGVTGSGKTFTMANIIADLGRPALIIAHNKTLTAQLAQEFKEFFPENAVHYFVSYYDYYQPEAYVVKTDTYIEKEATINEEIDRLRHAATESLLSRKDVIIVASVSCIYSIGEVEEYLSQVMEFEVGKKYEMENIISDLIKLQFKRAAADFKPGTFHIMGDVIEIFPSSSETVWTLDFFGDELDKITRRNFFTNEIYEVRQKIDVFPAKHTVTTYEKIDKIVPLIKAELEERLAFYISQGDVVKAERLKTKVEYDIEMMSETGYVNGIENYSMYLSGRKEGGTPSTLIDFFPENFLTFIDESHITVSQVGGMYAGDRSRKENLIENGFRLPSAFENRPLKFTEFEKKIGQTVFVSATPSDFELNNSSVVVEQIIRPTGLLDPLIEIEDMEFMIDDIMRNIREAKDRNERVLITTLTKRSSEELSAYLASNGLKVRFLHSEIETLERLEILKDLRTGKIDVLVGVNLLREGLDLPEVSFIGIIDAEKQGFLRSARALLQIIGRAARNVNGKVTMYSYKKKISAAMQEVIEITIKRRKLQEDYNSEHGIIPSTIFSKIKELAMTGKKNYTIEKGENLQSKIKYLELEMDIASANLDFEKAAELRDALLELKKGRK